MLIIMKKESFQIGNITFKWGDTLADIKAQLSIKDNFVENANPYALDKTLTIELAEMWSIKTNSCEFSAPAENRLIHRIAINIAAGDQYLNRSWLKIFIKHPLIEKLKKQLGSPATHRVNDNQNSSSSSVVENANWSFDNCEVGISIFGGVRDENGESNIGLIYITLKDIELLDSLYAQPLRDIEEFLKNKVDISTVKTFKMQVSQRIYWSLSLDARPYPTHSIDFISRALNGFHNRALFQTPLSIQAQLNSFEVCTWQATTGDYYLSNVYETILLNDSLETLWSNILPAKGNGHGHVAIGDFSIDNEHSRDETQKLVHHLEQLLDTNIVCFEDYDC